MNTAAWSWPHSASGTLSSGSGFRCPPTACVTGVASVRAGAHLRFECVVVGYDYTVLAGTQGHQGHRKVTRLLTVAERNRLPVILVRKFDLSRACL